MDNEKCPKCGCVEIGKGTLAGEVSMIPVDKFFSLGTSIYADICTECGYIIQMFVENPEKFKE